MKRTFSEDEPMKKQWATLRKGDVLTDVPMEKYRSVASSLTVERAVTSKNWTQTMDRQAGTFTVRRVR